MRIAVLSDVHEDFQRLQKAFKSIESHGCESVVCLGDITGFASQYYDHKPNANACIDLVRDKAHYVVPGNHDLFLAKRFPKYYPSGALPENWFQLSLAERRDFSDSNLWLYEEETLPVLSNDNFQYLTGLSEHLILPHHMGHILLSHYVFPDLCGITKWFLNYAIELRGHFHFMSQKDCSISFAGHKHSQYPEIAGRFLWQKKPYDTFQLKNLPKIVFCPPIAGRKFPGGYLIFDLHTHEISTVLLG